MREAEEPDSGCLKLAVKAAAIAGFVLLVVFELLEEGAGPLLIDYLTSLPKDGLAVAAVMFLIGVSITSAVGFWPDKTIRSLWPVLFLITVLATAAAYVFRLRFGFPATLARWVVVLGLSLLLGFTLAAIIHAVRSKIILIVAALLVFLCLLALGMVFSFTDSAAKENSTPSPEPTATPYNENPTAQATPSVTQTPDARPSATSPNSTLTPFQTVTPMPTYRATATVGTCPDMPLLPRPYRADHVVLPGETLSAIAAQYGTTVQALVDLNGPYYPTLADYPGCIRDGWWLVVR